MAKNKRERNLTLLGSKTVFSGHMKFQDGLVVEGSFSGTIDGLGSFEVSKSAKCKLDFIKANSVTVKGELFGNINATDYVELVNGARMKGNIIASKIKIDDNVEFEGAVKMIRDNVTVDNDFFTLNSDDLKSQLGR